MIGPDFKADVERGGSVDPDGGGAHAEDAERVGFHQALHPAFEGGIAGLVEAAAGLDAFHGALEAVVVGLAHAGLDGGGHAIVPDDAAPLAHGGDVGLPEIHLTAGLQEHADGIDHGRLGVVGDTFLDR